MYMWWVDYVTIFNNSFVKINLFNKMVSDKEFYLKFRKSVLAGVGDDRKEDESSKRVSYLVHQYKMIPADLEELFENFTRGYPTSPIYLFLCLGVMGTNVARYSKVRRIAAHREQAERTGTFLKFMAPSRFGKGISLSVVCDIGNHIEEVRSSAHHQTVSDALIAAGQDKKKQKEIRDEMAVNKPHAFFLTGANGLQTQASAAKNGGCGLIFVPEIKSGKCRFTDIDGSY